MAKKKSAGLSFEDCEEQILKRLDWQREYEGMGGRFTSGPNAGGWAECFSLFRDESKPSAAVNIASGNGRLGLYTDLGDESKAIPPWEVMARLRLAPSWEEARERLAAKAGVELPKKGAGRKHAPQDIRLPLIAQPIGMRCLEYWASVKTGVSVPHAIAAGAAAVTVNINGWTPGRCIRFHGYLSGKWDQPAATLLYPWNGGTFPASDKLPERRFHLVAGSESSLIIVGTPAALVAATDVFFPEGLTCALAAAPHLPAGWIAVATTCGAKSFPKSLAEAFRGKRLWTVGDADKPGQAGADGRARSCLSIASEVRRGVLPYDVEENHGRDVRDLVNDGGFPAWLAGVMTLPAISEADLKPLPITNGEKKSDDGGETTYTDALPLAAIIDRIRKHTGDWPRRVDQALFVQREGGVDWINSTAALFGWLQIQAGKIFWYRETGCVTKDELFCELRRTATAYAAIEPLPHEPKLPGHFYACGDCESGDGSTLAALIDRFLPATPIDRDLIQAAMMTVLWGGHGGTRPCFVITSDDGRGVGKSKLAEMVGHIVGGFLSFSNNEQIAEIKGRLLSPDGLTRRVGLLDNVKSMRFSWGELEALITAPIVSGKRMYVGEASRPNTLTWFITLNGASLSTDMAQRAIPIKLKRPAHAGDWEETTIRFLLDNRQKIVADLLGWLRNEPAKLERFSRWATWERAVLARLPEPAGIQATIAERQGTIDVEADEAEQIEEFFEGRLRALYYDPLADRVFIPSMIAADWLNRATNDNHKVISAGRMLSQLCDEGRFRRLKKNLSRSQFGRGFFWEQGEKISTFTDLDRRIAEQKQRERELARDG